MAFCGLQGEINVISIRRVATKEYINKHTRQIPVLLCVLFCCHVPSDIGQYHCRDPPFQSVFVFQNRLEESLMAKNYRNSDYALNKYSTGIVYRFSGEIVEVTLEDYLVENPDKTEQDFLELKALSDDIYHQQVVGENRTSRLDISLNGLEDTIISTDALMDEQLIEVQDMQLASEALAYALETAALTEVQLRRFRLHIIDGLSTRQIAKMESATQRAIMKSIHAAIEKLKKVFKF